MDFKELIELPEEFIRNTVEKHLPSFADACKSVATHVLMHQDAYGAGLQLQEMILLGMAIKYAGFYGKDVRITGSNGETIKK